MLAKVAVVSVLGFVSWQMVRTSEMASTILTYAWIAAEKLKFLKFLEIQS